MGFNAQDVFAKFMMNADAKLEALKAANFNTQHSLQSMDNRIGESSNISTELPRAIKDLSEIDTRVEERKDDFEVEVEIEELEVEEAINVSSTPCEQMIDVPTQGEIEEERGEDDVMSIEECEEVEEAQSSIIGEATCLNIDHSIIESIIFKCREKNSGIVFDDVGRKLSSSLNPTMPGLDNSQPKIFPWRPKQLLWAIEVHHNMLEKKIVDRMLKPPIDPPMQRLTSSQPNLFPWRPKQICGLVLKGILAGTIKEAGRRFKPSKDPPKLKLHNARPKLFPWRPKGSSFLAFNFTSSRKVRFTFLGSSYASSSREEHTVFKPP